MSTLTMTGGVQAKVRFECDKAMTCRNSGDIQAGQEAMAEAAKTLEHGDASISLETYLYFVGCSHLTRFTDGLEDLAKTWNLPEHYWDALTGDVACPVGSFVNRIMSRAAAPHGHVRSIALTVALNGVSTGGMREGLRALSMADEGVRRCAGRLAKAWTGSITQLIEAAQDSLDAQERA